MSLLLDAVEIDKRYAGHQALDQVSVQVKSGHIFGLLGPNGAGKTSLLRIINGITAPDGGQLQFEDRPMRREDVQRIGYLPEERGLYPRMRVGEQALYLAQLKGLDKSVAKARLHDWFERFDLMDWWKKPLHALSKGMQQKVQFITTVLHAPPLLILDEPFTGFDPLNAALIREEILRLKANGTSIILATHQMASVEELCDDIALLNHGKVILAGQLSEIRRARARQEYAVTFTGNLASFSHALWTQFELIEHQKAAGRITAHVRATQRATPNQLLHAILPAVEVHGLQEVIPSMEDIFIAQVRASSEAETGGDHA